MGFGSEYGNGGPGILPGHFIVCSLLWVDARGVFLSCWFPPLTGGITFFLRRQEESKQRRRRPWVGAGCAGSLRYSVLAGAAELGLRPQTGLALCPPAPALLGTSQGARKASRRERSAFGRPVAVDGGKRVKIKIDWRKPALSFPFQGGGESGLLLEVMLARGASGLAQFNVRSTARCQSPKSAARRVSGMAGSNRCSARQSAAISASSCQ